jgi:LuxR family transcriptional regulator, maltose regulon positive regulatory protein
VPVSHGTTTRRSRSYGDVMADPSARPPAAQRADGPGLPPLEAGWAALSVGRWSAARRSFTAALERERTAEALEGLSWAAWWLDDAPTVFDAREHAFRLYRQRGDGSSAARMATWMAADQLDFNGAAAVASGWLRRASRLLEPVEPGPDHGWHAFHDGYLGLLSGDGDRCLRQAARAAELGRRFQVPDLEMLGLALQGSGLVDAGAVDEGMACLDEATATALGGEALIPISSAWTCCFMVSACEAVRDYARAYQWCDRIDEFSRRYGSRYIRGLCRAGYGAVHVWRGAWEQAEVELCAAIEAYARSRPAFVPDARVRLAELRRRQGRFEEAEELLGETAGSSALSCRARVALDRGDARQAAELAERLLRSAPGSGVPGRVPALELLIRACARRHGPERAAAAADELRAIAQRIGTTPLRAASLLADGLLAAADGAHERARDLFEEALDGFLRSGAPFEAAQVRIELSSSLAALERVEAAAREASLGLEALTALGATAEAGRARRTSELLGRAHHDVGPVRSVTPREREVLQWLAEGLTNRQIAERLALSEHTIHRHITNILRKLQLPSRTAAATYAVRSGLVGRSDP